MKAKIILGLVAVLVLCVGGYFYAQINSPEYKEQQAVDGNGTSSNQTIPPGAQAHPEPPVETPHVSDLMGIVIYDDVKIDGASGIKLSSGDVVYVIDDNKSKPGFAKIKTKNEQEGYIPSSKYMAMPSWENISSFYYSTAPITQMFQIDPVQSSPEDRKKFDDLIDPSFLERAQKNSDASVSAWASELIRLAKLAANPDAEQVPVPEETEPSPGN